MSNSLKIVGVVLLSVAVGVVFILGGFRLFVRTIYTQHSCDWANIDNVELHTRVNVPAITHDSCTYRKDINTKIARFDINKVKVDMKDYIRQNKFAALGNNAVGRLDHLLMAEADAGLFSDHSLYLTSGSYKTETWQAMLDSTDARLWVVIRYQD